MAVMRCMVATPTRSLFEGEITYAGIPGADGAYGVLPGHELMLSLNRQGGVLTLDLGENGQDRREFLIMGGATQVFNDKVTVLARYGIAVEDIDEAAVRAEADACRQVVADLDQRNDPQDQATLDTNRKMLEWCEAQLNYTAAR